MGRWKNLLDNAPEGATHVDLIFPNQMQRDIDWIGGVGGSQKYFYRKSVQGEWYRFDQSKGHYNKAAIRSLKSRISCWRLLRNLDDTEYLVSLDLVRIMVRQFEGEE